MEQFASETLKNLDKPINLSVVSSDCIFVFVQHVFVARIAEAPEAQMMHVLQGGSQNSKLYLDVELWNSDTNESLR